MSNVKELTSFWSLNLFENIIQFRIRKSNNQVFLPLSKTWFKLFAYPKAIIYGKTQKCIGNSLPDITHPPGQWFLSFSTDPAAWNRINTINQYFKHNYWNHWNCFFGENSLRKWNMRRTEQNMEEKWKL